MKKAVVILAIIMTVTGSRIYAQQTPFKWTFGISGGIAKRQTFNEVLGADFGFEARISKVFSASAGVGFEHLFEHDFVNREKYGYPYGQPYNTYPILVGLKADIGSGFYVAAKAGIAIGAPNKSYENSFIWTPSVGFALKNGLDFSVRYEDYTKIRGSQNFGLRIGYSIPFKKK
ncbi:hypothetical protein [Mucilaginibacter sp. KACC 22063]|uniref:hypothetical protein n=1 Tax=Mucilaginibacter sp. KACC 22063 TaxID=3025666 RepID=UPI002365BF87|nr:hypothetical protein [Mucilaginibacter sp. KACC 22063]WDF57232.1 hypothetical protein PQ461_09225 [Mucilaginibacter sp. KACC 22063]